VLTVDADGRQRVHTWWSPSEVVERGQPGRERQVHPGSSEEAELIDEVADALERSVRIRMLANVPLGAFLSGGIDSTIVVALMQAQSRQPVRTFTVGLTGRVEDPLATHSNIDSGSGWSFEVCCRVKTARSPGKCS